MVALTTSVILWIGMNGRTPSRLTTTLRRGTLRAMGGVLRKKASVALAFAGPLCAAACSSGRISVGDDRAPIVVTDSGGKLDVGASDSIADDVVDAGGAFDATPDVADGAGIP